MRWIEIIEIIEIRNWGIFLPVCLFCWCLGVPTLHLSILASWLLNVLSAALCFCLLLLRLEKLVSKARKNTAPRMNFALLEDFNTRSLSAVRVTFVALSLLCLLVYLFGQDHAWTRRYGQISLLVLTPGKWKSPLFQRIQRILRAIFYGRVEHKRLYTFFICSPSIAWKTIKKTVFYCIYKFSFSENNINKMFK